MFAKSIVLSDAFLDMPLSARCLYFTLGMLADDDGFVGNPKSIMRQCGASQDDMAVLLQKRYVLGFESGVIVIKHWRMNNYLQNDRKKTTTYIEELEQLTLDEKGAYTEREKSMYTKCIQNVYTGKDSIDKDRLDKDSIGKYNTPLISPLEEEPKPKKEPKITFGEYQNVKLTQAEYDRLANEYSVEVRNKCIEFLDAYIEEKGYKSKSHNLAIRRWVVDAVNKKSGNKQRDILDELMGCE